jgi:hypothetical protein
VSRVEALPPVAAEALLEHLERIQHDIGKYVAFETRFLDPDASDDELRGALIADLRHTRRDARGSQGVLELWEASSGPLLGRAPLEDGSRVDLSREAELCEILASLAGIAGLLPGLDAAPRGELERARACALAISASLKSLRARVRRIARP